MTDPLQDLLDIEAIKALKARYFRLLDTQQWDEWGLVFSEQVVMEVPEAEMVNHGRAEVVDTVRAALTGARTVHHGHMPEIEQARPQWLQILPICLARRTHLNIAMSAAGSWMPGCFRTGCVTTCYYFGTVKLLLRDKSSPWVPGCCVNVCAMLGLVPDVSSTVPQWVLGSISD